MPVRTCNHVLVVEDDAAVLRLFKRALEQEGYQVSVASNGQIAARMLVEEPFCAAVSDIAIPGMSGIELLRCARAHDLDVPIILVTGGSDMKTVTGAVSYGAFQLLMKPVAPGLLVGEVKRAAKLHAMASARRSAMRLLEVNEAEQSDLEVLRATLQRTLGSLRMAYQPIVQRDGKIFGFEALMRSDEPALPSPLAILDAAERLDALPDLSRTVRARSAGGFDVIPEDTALFVNLHARDLLDTRLADPDEPLARMAHRVVFEITERASLSEVPDLRARVAALRARGYRIAIDDLGAGYAGLTSFTLLEPDFVKIDLSLVRDVDRTPIKRKLIRLIVATCKDLGISVVAEGIESREERDVLLDLGCDLLQGYWLAMPAFPPPATRW